MKTPDKDFLNLTEYGKHRGVSDVMVGKAIREGKIVKGVVVIQGRKLVDWRIADEEWDKHKNPARPRETKGTRNKVDAEPPKVEAGSYADIKRMKEALIAKKLDLEIKKREGKLVDKDAVYRALFTYGQEIRMNLEGMPDRVINKIISKANDPHAARLVLVNEIEHILLELSKSPNIG